MSVKDGLPSTDFSRMNREWVKAVAGGGSVGVGLPAVTEADNGKILGVVNGEWGAMDAGGGGSSDFSTAEVTVTVGALQYRVDFYGNFIVNDALSAIASFEPSSSGTLIVILYKGESQELEVDTDAESITTTGDVTEDDKVITVAGNGTITFA